MATSSIKKSEEIQNIIKNGKKLSSPFFSFFYLITEGISGVASVAPKKTFTKAVLRNKAKRKLRAIIQLQDLRNISCVIMAKSLILKTDFKELVESLKKVIDKAK